jgi:hypothetical protein
MIRLCFMTGVLKHKDLSGQVVSSQVYGYGDDCNGDDDEYDANADHHELDTVDEEDNMDVDQNANDNCGNQEEDVEAGLD